MSLMEELTYALVVLTLGLVIVTGFYAYERFEYRRRTKRSLRKCGKNGSRQRVLT